MEEKLTYVKLFRKAKDNPVMDDPVAWQIFCWILLSVDYKTGQMKLGRFWAAQRLKLKPTTFYAALKRLQEKYKIIETKVEKMTIKYTVVTVINWHIYQGNDNPMTIQRQSNDTTQEYKNKRIKEDSRKTVSVARKQPSCPLLNGLSDKYPLGHAECVEYILGCEENRGIKFINRPKQYQFLHKILKAGWDFPDLDQVVAQVEKKYGVEAWDFTTLANWLEKGGVGNSTTKKRYN